MLLIVFSYAKYSKGMEELAGFGMKNSLTLPSLANEYSNSLRDENDEPIYTYTGQFIIHFGRQSIKTLKCTALNQWYKSTVSDQVFIIMSQELGVNDYICETLDKNFGYTNEHRRIIQNEYDSQFKGYRDNDPEERTENINNKFSKLPTHEQLQKLNVHEFMMDFDARSLFPSAMWDEKSVFPKKETWFALKPHMKKLM